MSILRTGEFTVCENKTDYEALKLILKQRLNEKRYYHSLCVADEGVAETARRLAAGCGVSPARAYLAGLLHDITKNAPKAEHLKIFADFGIIPNEIEKGAEKLWHAMSGAAYVEHILGIKDPEIIDAIRYHTTAKANMSLLAKILYLADFTSADRDYEDVDVIREYVDESLQKAFVYALQYSIKDLVEQARAVHLDTVAAYNEAVL